MAARSTCRADFEGERNLVILAFQREQQALVDSWSPAIADLLARYADLRFYELPTISRGNPLFRAWLDGAMRGGIPDHQAREHTITLYLDKAAFRQALDLPHEDTIYALLLEQEWPRPLAWPGRVHRPASRRPGTGARQGRMTARQASMLPFLWTTTEDRQWLHAAP